MDADTDLALTIGQPVAMTSATGTYTSATHVSRIIALTDHSLTVGIPYDAGRIVLWPMGAKLAVRVHSGNRTVTFQSEIIGRDLGALKSYTLLRPYNVATTDEKQTKAGLSRVIAITSGKGGVGKTTFTINLAVAFAAKGQRVFVIDADLGTANADVLLGINPQYNLSHVINGEKNLLDIASPAPGNIAIIPGGSGLQELTQLSASQFTRIIHSFNQMEGLADIVIIDTGAGISRDVSNFLMAADEVIVLTNTEPHAMTDAYAIVKVMHRLKCPAKQMLVVNRADSEAEAEAVSLKLSKVIKYYLQRDIIYLGHILDDKTVSRSLKEQFPLFLSYPDSKPALNIGAIASKLLNQEPEQPKGISGFISKMTSFFQKRA